MSGRHMRILTLRKQALQTRSADLRVELEARVHTTLSPAYALADRVRGARRLLGSPPVLVAGAGAALLLLKKNKPRTQKGKLLNWGGRIWWLWRTWRQVQPLLSSQHGQHVGDGAQSTPSAGRANAH